MRQRLKPALWARQISAIRQAVHKGGSLEIAYLGLGWNDRHIGRATGSVPDFECHCGRTMNSAKSITIAFVDEGSRSPLSIEVSETLAMALSYAAYVNLNKESFAISFNSLFIGLLATPDSTGDWLRMQFERTNADLEGLLHRRGLARDQLDELVKAGPPPMQSSQPALPFTRTGSARQALEEAERRAHAASQVTDTAHVLAALVSLPGFHDSDFGALRIDRDAWAAALSEWLPSYTSPLAAATLDFDLRAPGIEPHVMSALQHANVLAGSMPIGPSHVATAIVRLAASIKSVAFKRFAQLVPLPSDSALGSPGVLPDAARFEEDLRRRLARAQQAKAGSTERSPVWGRDLVTAVLLCAAEQVGPVVTAAGRSLDTVRDLWYAFVTADSKHRPVAEWASWWREANVPLPEPRRSGYATETDQGDDKLGVDAEARAFARLILDKDVHAPLSIGLLGDWGSGKSFFIEQIKKEIAALRNERRPELYAEIVEIEFNAWHASDSNLWASLVTNIFDEIWNRVSPADGTRTTEEARVRLKWQIEHARGALHEVEAQVQVGRDTLEMAELDLKGKREKLAWNNYVVSITSKELQRLAKDAGWHQSIETINDVENAVRSLTASGNRLRRLASTLLEKPLLHIALPTGLLLACTAVAWLLIGEGDLEPLTERLTKLLATVAGVVGALVVPLKAATQKVGGLADTLERVRREYDEKLAEASKEDSAETRAEAQVVARARRELESTEASVNAARIRLGELLNEQATLDPRRRLGAFLQERVQSTQYRSQQGIISLVHKDFRELSKYMKDLRESAATEIAGDVAGVAIRPFDRIVLYVDDLDRCRPEHVVNMLEAVHLLLALDLFVVVVAVDSRWLTRALEVYYHDLLTATDGMDSDGMRASTPQSYLEKIFQITYALGPMDPNRFGNYVAFLAGAEEAKTDGKTMAGTGAGVSPTVTPAPSGQPGDKAAEKGQKEPTETAGGGTVHGDAHADRGVAKTTRPPSPSVRIDKSERDFIGRLVPLLPTPRIAKRLVNVYRVIKAGKSAEELDTFEREGRATTCLLMLAILFGRPGIAAELLRALHEQRPPFEKQEEQLIVALRRGPPDSEPTDVRDSWDKLIAVLETIGITESVGNCARESKEVARYSLVSGHDWHTWSNPPGKIVLGAETESTDGQRRLTNT